jgi:predicted nucleic acid-binding Zn ribbon protein
VSVRGGVLVVAVDDPAWATEIRFLEAALKVRLNAELSENAVASIEVRVRPRTGENT